MRYGRSQIILRYRTMDMDAEARRIQEFVDRGNYHAAINIALSALNENRRHNDVTGMHRFLNIIKGIVQVLEKDITDSD